MRLRYPAAQLSWQAAGKKIHTGAWKVLSDNVLSGWNKILQHPFPGSAGTILLSVSQTVFFQCFFQRRKVLCNLIPMVGTIAADKSGEPDILFGHIPCGKVIFHLLTGKRMKMYGVAPAFDCFQKRIPFAKKDNDVCPVLIFQQF